MKKAKMKRRLEEAEERLSNSWSDNYNLRRKIAIDDTRRFRMQMQIDELERQVAALTQTEDAT
jgi:hypothetical protein